MKQIELTYEQFLKDAKQLLNKVQENYDLETYGGIFCPLRGGFFLSYYLSEKLKLPVHYLEIASYENKKQQGLFRLGTLPVLKLGMKYLICDDVIDSGKTIHKIKELYPDRYFDIVSLFVKTSGKFQAGLYTTEVMDDVWINFFWELW